MNYSKYAGTYVNVCRRRMEGQDDGGTTMIEGGYAGGGGNGVRELVLYICWSDAWTKSRANYYPTMVGGRIMYG